MYTCILLILRLARCVLAATVFSSVVLAGGICGISFASPTATATATATAAVHQTVDFRGIVVGVLGPTAVVHDQRSILSAKRGAKRGQRHVPAENIRRPATALPRTVPHDERRSNVPAVLSTVLPHAPDFGKFTGDNIIIGSAAYNTTGTANYLDVTCEKLPYFSSEHAIKL